jgi:hypothetical protein
MCGSVGSWEDDCCVYRYLLPLPIKVPAPGVRQSWQLLVLGLGPLGTGVCKGRQKPENPLGRQVSEAKKRDRVKYSCFFMVFLSSSRRETRDKSESRTEKESASALDFCRFFGKLFETFLGHFFSVCF